MNKVKHVAIVIGTLSLMGVATASLADSSSTCGTTISQKTASCLSRTATINFIKNYKVYLAEQGGSSDSNGNEMFSGPKNSANADNSQSQNKQPTAASTIKNKSNQQEINWF